MRSSFLLPSQSQGHQWRRPEAGQHACPEPRLNLCRCWDKQGGAGLGQLSSFVLLAQRWPWVFRSLTSAPPDPFPLKPFLASSAAGHLYFTLSQVCTLPMFPTPWAHGLCLQTSPGLYLHMGLCVQSCSKLVAVGAGGCWVGWGSPQGPVPLLGVAAVYRSSGELGQGLSCSSAVGVWNLAGTGRAIACTTLAIAVGAAGVHGG